jgi:hypothetical protein
MAIPYPAKYHVVDSIVYNPLHLPGSEPVFMNFVIEGGQNLLLGSVLGRVTATGKLKLVNAAAGDGSEVPVAILCENMHTFDKDGVTPLDMMMAVAVGGYFNETVLHYGAGYTDANMKQLLLARNIHTRAPGYSG